MTQADIDRVMLALVDLESTDHLWLALDAQEVIVALQSKITDMTEVLKIAIKQLRASAGSDPSFDTNRELKKAWADELERIIK